MPLSFRYFSTLVINSAVKFQCSLLEGAIEIQPLNCTTALSELSQFRCSAKAIEISLQNWSLKLKITKTKRYGDERFCTITTHVRTYRLSINLFPNGFISSVVFLVSIVRTDTVVPLNNTTLFRLNTHIASLSTHTDCVLSLREASRRRCFLNRSLKRASHCDWQ